MKSLQSFKFKSTLTILQRETSFSLTKNNIHHETNLSRKPQMCNIADLKRLQNM